MNFYVWEKEGQILIIDGHSRHEVLQLLESGAIYPKNPDGKEYSVTIPDKLPCSFLHLKNKTEAKKAVLIYNSKYKNIDSDILAEWVSDLNLDELKSQIEIPELKLDFDMPQELENDSIDDAAKIKTDIKVGDLIEIGRHRLLCGDSTKKEDVERLMNGAKADMVFTDPPYGINIVTGGKVGGDKSFGSVGTGNIVKAKNYPKIIGDNSTEYAKLFYNICVELGIENFIIWGGNYFTDFLYPSMGWIIWDKENTGNKFADCEIAWTSYQKATRLYKWLWNGMIRKGDVQLENNVRVHPTQKPVGLFQEIFNNYDFKICLDGFLGSGSTMVACQTLDRTCYGMELEPLYCQVIINRMKKNFPELEIKVNGTEYKES